jgi:hypothetical protein
MIRTFSRFAGLLFSLVGVQSFAQSLPIAVVPDELEPGSPVLLHVDAPAAAAVEGIWLGRKIQFFPARHGQGWYALAGVDVEAPTGPSLIEVSIRSGSLQEHLTRSLEIHPAHYRTGQLTVAPRFVEPDADSLARIKAEAELKKNIFASSASQPLWSSSFIAPVSAQPTDSFGTRRMFNGKLASIHKGMDFRAAAGTPVHSSNSGIVVLARPLYYEGNCVVIDHGLGLYTISMHLSRIDVKEGQSVSTGELLGLSGATGRVTGPHLHWAVRWHDAYLDPARLLRLDLGSVR